MTEFDTNGLQHIRFPYTVHETVSSRNLVIATVVVPVAVIIIVSLVLVPGLSTPLGVPRSLIWRRRLWELYASLLSYGLGMASQWFIINGLKNLCGKPRPDLLARCQPDLQNVAQYVVGGIANITSNGQLVSAAICTNADTSLLNDGFRSYPSGHSSSSAAGLGYIALFLAFKLGVVFPFARTSILGDYFALSASAFPSRSSIDPFSNDPYELHDISRHAPFNSNGVAAASSQPTRSAESQLHRSLIRAPLASRRSGAAPPLYLLVVVLVPLLGSIFIAASRWFDYRHHGFDIIFGYSIGAVTAVVAFRMYQLPMSHGAGWAWGPRSPDKAFWAGVGSGSWAEPWGQWPMRSYNEENEYGLGPHSTATAGLPLSQRSASRRSPDNGGTGPG